MTATWIMMRPMNDTSFWVPLIYSIERYDISFSEGRKSGGKINIMGNKQGLAGMEFQYKALMAASVVIIRQNFDDDTIPFRLNTAFAFVERNGQSRIILICKANRIVWAIELTPTYIDSDKEDNYGD